EVRAVGHRTEITGRRGVTAGGRGGIVSTGRQDATGADGEYGHGTAPQDPATRDGSAHDVAEIFTAGGVRDGMRTGVPALVLARGVRARRYAVVRDEQGQDSTGHNDLLGIGSTPEP